MLSDGLIARQTLSKLKAVMAPKLNGAMNICSQTPLLPLSSLVLFSSVATLLGNPGQSNYAAANSCLDALAEGLVSQVRLHGMQIVKVPAAAFGFPAALSGGFVSQERPCRMQLVKFSAAGDAQLHLIWHTFKNPGVERFHHLLQPLSVQ